MTYKNFVGFREKIGMLSTEQLGLRDKVYVTYCKDLLVKFKEAFTTSDKEEEVLERLGKILAKNWEMVRGTALCYTAIPESDATQILCEAAEFISMKSMQNSKQKPIDVLHVLMPGVNCEVRDDRYPSLQPYEEALVDNKSGNKFKVDIKRVIKTHIVGDGNYLVPVSLLGTLKDSTQLGKMYKPYYDVDYTNPKDYYLSERELSRLLNHSILTQNLKNALDCYEGYSKDKSTLLDHLKALCQKLRLNSVDMLGKENNASEGVYPAIIAFNNYYQSLGENAKKEIPTKVRAEIDKLLSLSSDKDKNKNATENIETCIATRRQFLENAIREEEVKLSEIAITDKCKRDLTETAKKEFNSCKKVLKKRILENQYSGNEPSFLTKQLLATLKVNPSISSLNDLNDLLALDSEEVAVLLKEETLKKQALQQIGQIEDLIVLFTETKPEKLKALLAVMGDDLAKSFIKTPADFAALLMTLTEERFNIVINAYIKSLPTIIKSGADFGSALKFLSAQQRTLVYNGLKDKLPKIIKSGKDFENVLWYLSADQRTAVCNALKDKLPTIIKSSSDFGCVLAYLSIEQCTAVCDALKDKLPTMIKSGDDFGSEFRHLSIEQCTAVCDALKDKLPTMIKSGEDFRSALWYLSAEQRTAVFNAMKDKLPEIIKSGDDFGRALQCLSAEQRTAVFNAMKDKLPEIIKSGDDFGTALKYLSIEQCTAVCDALKDKLPTMIKSGEDFGSALWYLSAEQRTAVFNAMKDKLPTIIKSSGDFVRALQYLSIEQCTAVCNALKDKLPTMIKSGEDFGRALWYLSAEQRTAVFNAMKDKLLTIIKSSGDFVRALQYLSIEQCAAVCDVLKDKLPTIIKGGEDFGCVLAFLSAEQGTAVFNAMKDKLPTIIKNGEDFGTALKYLSIEQCTAVCNAMKDKLPGIINNIDILNNILNVLYDINKEWFFKLDCMPNLLPKIILKINKDIPKIYKLLNTNEEVKLFNQAFFSGLLLELEKFNNDNMADETIKSDVTELLKRLTKGSDTYFKNNQTDSYSLKIFQDNCVSDIGSMKNLLHDNQGLFSIIGKILLAVFTFGLAPLVSTIKSKYETGIYKCRFFEAPGEREADDISRLVNEFKPSF